MAESNGVKAKAAAAPQDVTQAAAAQALAEQSAIDEARKVEIEVATANAKKARDQAESIKKTAALAQASATEAARQATTMAITASNAEQAALIAEASRDALLANAPSENAVQVVVPHNFRYRDERGIVHDFKAGTQLMEKAYAEDPHSKRHGVVILQGA